MLPVGRFYVETPTGNIDIHVGVDDLQAEVRRGSGENVHQLCRLFTSWLALLADSPLERKPYKIMAKFRKELLASNPKELILRYSSMADEVLEHCTLYGSGSETGEYLKSMEHTPIFMEYHHWYKTADTPTLQYLLTFLWWGKKVEFEDPELHAIALRDWRDVEEKLSRLVLPTHYPLRAVFDKFFPAVSPISFSGHFGPGAVAEQGIRGNYLKSENLGSHPRLAYVFTRKGNPREHLGYVSDVVAPSTDVWTRRISSDTSQLRFVRKNIKAVRSICMEPNAFMYAQQHVRRMLELRISRSPLGRRIKIRDQSINRSAALEGSLAGLIDTIDLKWASDSVSTQLVRLVFPPDLLLHLLGTRTAKVRLPDGEVVKVAKFAPMGSAVCFPVQCMIYATVAMLASLEYTAEVRGTSIESLLRLDGPALMRTMFHRETGGCRRLGFAKLEPISVYGDDITCDTRITQRVISILSELGFTINVGKSFMGGQCFRESCGGYFFSGSDVTPLFYRVKYSGKELTVKALASCVAAANNAGDRKLKNVQRYFTQLALWTPLQGLKPTPGKKNQLPFTDDRTAWGIFSHTVRNDHIVKKRRASQVFQQLTPQQINKLPTNVRYQRDEMRCVTVGYSENVKHKSDAFDRYLLTAWWGSRGEDDSQPVFAGDPRVEGRKLAAVWRWIPDGR